MELFYYLYSRLCYISSRAWFIDFMVRFCDIIPRDPTLALFLCSNRLLADRYIVACMDFLRSRFNFCPCAWVAPVRLWNFCLDFFVLNFCQNQPINRRPGVAWSNEIMPVTLQGWSLDLWSEFYRLLADEWRRCTVMWLLLNKYHIQAAEWLLLSSWFSAKCSEFITWRSHSLFCL